MPELSSLLDLPTEIRLQIYEAFFSSSIVRARAVAEPLSHTNSPLCLLLSCKRVRSESLPLVYEHALFWVDSFGALACMVNHHTPAQLQSVHHFAVRSSLVPLPHPKTYRTELWETNNLSTSHEILYRAFYQQICCNLDTLVLFNTTDAGTRRRILEQQAGRSFTNDEFESHCFDGMRLKAHLLIPVLKEQNIVMGPNHLNSNEDFIPFRIMLRYSGSDNTVCPVCIMEEFC